MILIEKVNRMLSDKRIWKNKPVPRDQESGQDSGNAYFGYDRVPSDQKTDKVLQHFNSVAVRYDFMNTLLSFGIHYLWKRDAVRQLKLKPGESVLDVCGGTGDLSILAQKIVGPAGLVVLYDINRAMILAGRAKTTNRESRKRIQYVQGNAEVISFPENTFDHAIVGYGIRNVTHMEKGFREMHRVLKPGGRLVCLEFSKPTAPFFRWLYDIYSLHIMPFLGALIVANRAAYTHLPESIRTFPLPDRLSQILEEIGFGNVFYHKQTNGISVVHTGVKK